MQRVKAKSISASALTAGSELLLFTVVSFFTGGLLLLVARWVIGASGALANFFLNRNWAFSATGDSRRRQGLRYGVTAISAVTIASALWWGLVQTLSVDPRILHLLSMMGVWFTFTFPLMRGWVFADSRRGQALHRVEESFA